jgi:glutamine amidotransferase PdxT
MKFNVIISAVGGKDYRTAIEASTIAEVESVLLKNSSWYEFPVGAALVKVNPTNVVSVEFHPEDHQYSDRIEAYVPAVAEVTPTASA